MEAQNATSTSTDTGDDSQTSGTPERLEAARMRLLWRSSAEYKATAKWRVPSLAIGFFLAVGVGLVWFATPAFDEVPLDPFAHVAIGLYAAILVFIMPPYIWALRHRLARRAFNDQVTLGLVADLQKQESELPRDEEGKTDLASLWVVTQRRIDLYHNIATRQAENSFRVGQVAAVSGFVTVLIMGGIAAFTASATGAIAASVVGVAGAAMSGYIGATFMKAQAEASAQLRQFFLQPVEFARMLGVERLLTALPESDRPAAVQHIITSMMTTRTDDTK